MSAEFTSLLVSGRVPLAEVDPDRWDDLLAHLEVADTYYSRGYVEASASLADGRPVFLHLHGEGGDVVFPCLLRAEPADVVTPYGYGGPLAVGQAPPSFAEPYADWCAARSVVSTFAVFHPLFANHQTAPGAGFNVSAIGRTVPWRIQEGNLLEGMHKHHRRLARKALGEHYEATVEVGGTDLREFITLYEQTMRRAGASAYYFFASSYWSALARDIDLVRVDVRRDGVLGASVLGFGSPPWLHYHLGANSDDGRRAGASQLALLTLARWGQANGFDTLHLGGGVGGAADSLHAYKQRFDPGAVAECFIGKAVHDLDAYRELSGVDAVDWAGFFPAYRAPR